MAQKESLTKLERKAKSYLLGKEISPGKMEAVRSLMNNSRIDDIEKYNAIIELLKNCPEKKIVDKPQVKNIIKNEEPKKSAAGEKIVNLSGAKYGPKETTQFIDYLYHKFKYLKFFRKRYLVHRNNRIGIGIRKRLIPSSKFLKAMKTIGEQQVIISSRLPVILNDILKDEAIDNPKIFNYLRIIRKWMMGTPLVKHDLNIIKWMERNNFEREFSSYLINYFSFLKMGSMERESIVELMELKLRQMEDLKKDDILENDSDLERRVKEKGNLDKETVIFRYISLFRSFLPSGMNDDNLIAGILKDQYNINGLSEFLFIAAEALIFQHEIIPAELIEFFNISSPAVSSEKWDFNEESLKKAGKDPESKKRRELEKLRLELEPYETLVKLLQMENEGKSILMKGVENQWELMDNRRHSLGVIYEEDFFSFIDGIIQYFRNSYLYLINGSIVYLKDADRNEYESSLFEAGYLNEDMQALDSILNEMHFYKSNNPNLAIKRNEVKKIMKNQMETMAYAREYLTALGNFFYNTGKKLSQIIELHNKWVFNHIPLLDAKIIREPLKKDDLNLGDRNRGKPLPFYDCAIKDFYKNNALTKKLIGKKIMGSNPYEGIFYQVIAFLYQAAHECFNEQLNSELEERKNIIRKIDGFNT